MLHAFFNAVQSSPEIEQTGALRSLSAHEYNVGWICALDIELTAATMVLDEEHEYPYDLKPTDNQYQFGSIGSHNIVISVLPSGIYGNNSASLVAHQFRHDFPSIDLRFMVGLGGGAPSEEHDIRLADVVVSQPSGTSPGVVQYDFGKYMQDGEYLRAGVLDKPPRKILMALPRVKKLHPEMLSLEIAKIVDDTLVLNPLDDRFIMVPRAGDTLFVPDYHHAGPQREMCKDVCDFTSSSIRSEINGNYPLFKYPTQPRKTLQQIARGIWAPQIIPADSRNVMVHFGPIASGNSVIRDGVHREELRRRTGALCFEMEAAGIMDIWPCLVVRGICDYSDSHKNKDWQPISALTAAAFTKHLLLGMQGPGRRHRSRTPEPPPPTSRGMEARTLHHRRSEKSREYSGSPPREDIFQVDDYQHLPVPRPRPTTSEGHNFTSVSASISTMSHTVDSDDTKTNYSGASSVSISVQEVYIYELADALSNEIQDFQLSTETLIRLTQALPNLLKVFALQIGYKAKSQMHLDIMFFISRNRRRGLAQREERAKTEVMENMAGIDVISHWRTEPQEMQDPNTMLPEEPVDKYEPDWQHKSGPEEPEIKPEMKPEIESVVLTGYRNLIFKSPAYQWLVKSLHRELILERMDPDIMGSIRHELMKSLPSSKIIDKRKPSEAFRVLFILEWELMRFLEEQQSSIDDIEQLITLTGSLKNAQALTTIQYLKQTWPSTGEQMIQLIKTTFKGSVKGGRIDMHSTTLTDKTQVFAKMQDSTLSVEALGIIDTLAELAEQLAWLGAALQSSPHETGIASCAPFISEIYQPDIIYKSYLDPPLPEFICKIGFKVEGGEHQPSLSESTDGRCWHNMFKNPVIVPGYPIPRRRKHNTGLEIPLNMMTGLVQTERLNFFHGKLFIKGFSAMLVPIEQDGDIIKWHFLNKPDGGRISYIESYIPQNQKVERSALLTARHIVGWCLKAQYLAGTADISYNIGTSDLEPAHQDQPNSFEQHRIFRGQKIPGKTDYIMIDRDKPSHFSHLGDSNFKALKWIHKKYVVLWDDKVKRGWLINGTSALLHIIRASLENDILEDFPNLGTCFRMGIQDVSDQRKHQPIAAFHVLWNHRCIGQNKHPPEEGSYCVKDTFEEVFELLEKMIDSQEKILKGGGLLSKPRRYLEGWDFHDLATSEDSIYQRVTTIKTIGKGWIDFIRAIGAISLFGRGFGDIIKPTGSTSCKYWETLPTGKYYLAASIGDLQTLLKVRKDEKMRNVSIRLPDTHIIWYSPEPDSVACQNAKNNEGRCSDLVQVFLPSKLIDELPNNVCSQWNTSGAVVFGYNSDLKWVWKDTGDPQKLDSIPKSPTEESWLEAYDRDSGVGSTSTFQIKDYTIGIMCALPKELFAIRALFDETHQDVHRIKGDPVHYATGRMENYNVVAAALLAGSYGTNAATKTLLHMRRTFDNLSCCFLVGIGAGIASSTHDIRLGDIVVSHPRSTYPGVVQYDLGKDLGGNTFQEVGSLSPPHDSLLYAINHLKSDPSLTPDKTRNHIESCIKMITAKADPNSKYEFPGIELDPMLVDECVKNPNHKECDRCRDKHRNFMKVHYGTIASGNLVVKNGETRDKLLKDYGALCIEMEAAGAMCVFPCLVVRGISDYADADKNDIWQDYASATAASYLKLFLRIFQNESKLGDLTSRKRVQQEGKGR